MGTDVTEVTETLPRPQDIKVHRLMCTKLIKLVDRILTIFPEIEASRPRCSSGLKAISSLNEGIKKARLLLEHCSVCSKLYLAITGEAVLSRCKRSTNLLEQCLSQIQNDVPVLLAAEISCMVSDMRDATFSLDSFEEEAGIVVRSFLQQYASSGEPLEDSAIETLRFAALRLQITSQKALLIEKRSIRKLLDKVGDVDPAKKQILLYLLDLLKKYGQLIVREQAENDSLPHKDYPSLEASCDVSVKAKSGMEITPDNSITDMLKRPVPPEEFKCPISSRLMYDPVVIASGQTFERMWIQKWFDEGHGTCPKTKTKLAHLSMTPNVAMKDLILKWCKETGDTILDPCIQLGAGSCETSFTSIASLSNSMKALSLPMDFSNISLESLDSSYSDSTQFKTRVRATLESAQADNESQRFQSCARTHERSNGFLDKLDELPWESRCKTVEDAKSRLKYDHQAYHSMSLEKFSEPLVRFLRSAHDQHDLEAQRTGIQLLLALVSMDRSSILNLPEEAYSLLASFLDAGVTEEARARKNEVTEDALALLEVLSSNQCCTPKIAVSQAPYSILRILETQIRELLEPAIKILYNLSMSKEFCSVIMPSEFIPRLVPLFEDMALASYCLSILKNLCTHPDSRASIAETDGCIASIAKLLEIDSHEVQEHGVYVLLSLCSQRLQYCQLVMDEGVIPALVSISINGSAKGKIFSAELLRLLRDIDYGDVQVCSGPDLDLPRDYSNQSTEKKSLFKASGFLGLKMSLFSKSKTSKKKK